MTVLNIDLNNINLGNNNYNEDHPDFGILNLKMQELFVF